jgi:glycosyltransferase involved in cell wall biosynthesis
VRDRLHLPGWHHDTGALLAACDALVVPSRLEPLGNVVIEGFSAARPVIAADSDGPRELIHDGVDGVLVPREDAAALALAVAGVLEDPGRALRLATAGRARFLSDHAEARVVARWRAGLARMAGSDTVLQGAA